CSAATRGHRGEGCGLHRHHELGAGVGDVEALAVGGARAGGAGFGVVFGGAGVVSGGVVGRAEEEAVLWALVSGGGLDVGAGWTAVRERWTAVSTMKERAAAMMRFSWSAAQAVPPWAAKLRRPMSMCHWGGLSWPEKTWARTRAHSSARDWSMGVRVMPAGS